MPHAVLQTGLVAATTDVGPRTLIPGVEPGGSRVGAPMKPALLIQDFTLELLSYNPSAAAGQKTVTLFLKLSQEPDLIPGLLLPIANLILDVEQVDATGTVAFSPTIHDVKSAVGTIWAPAYIGLRVVAVGGLTGFNCNVHLDYERVEIPWMDWFLRWDFLDNVTNNSEEY